MISFGRYFEGRYFEGRYFEGRYFEGRYFECVSLFVSQRRKWMNQRLLPSRFCGRTISLPASSFHISRKRLCIGIQHPLAFTPPPHRIQSSEHLPALTQRRLQSIIKPHQLLCGEARQCAFNFSERAYARKMPEGLRGVNSLLFGRHQSAILFVFIA
jgi:hypothetical protein